MKLLKTAVLTLALLLLVTAPLSNAQRRQQPVRKEIQITWLGGDAGGRDDCRIVVLTFEF